MQLPSWRRRAVPEGRSVHMLNLRHPVHPSRAHKVCRPITEFVSIAHTDLVLSRSIRPDQARATDRNHQVPVRAGDPAQTSRAPTDRTRTRQVPNSLRTASTMHNSTLRYPPQHSNHTNTVSRSRPIELEDFRCCPQRTLHAPLRKVAHTRSALRRGCCSIRRKTRARSGG